MLKSSISSDQYLIDFEIDVVEFDVESEPSNDNYLSVGLICVSVYAGILSAFALFVVWKRFKKRRNFPTHKGMTIDLTVQTL